MGNNDTGGFRSKAEELWLRFVRLYTYNTPVNKGKYRIYETALKMCRTRPDSIVVNVKDGRRLWANLTTGMHNTVFFLGEFEREVTRITASLVSEGDVCLDIGANFGWYTTLFYSKVGKHGAVHSFEPVPATFGELKRNVDLLGSPENVFINNVALGDKPGTVTLNLFEGLPTGHASISSQGRDDAYGFECPMITLDSYLEESGIERVDLVKVDIEGAEIMFLNGARKLFEQEIPPVFLMEMALQQTSNFGYLPNDLIEFIAKHGDYKFYAVDEWVGRLREIDAFAADDIGANVFCIPSGTHQAVIDRFI